MNSFFRATAILATSLALASAVLCSSCSIDFTQKSNQDTYIVNLDQVLDCFDTALASLESTATPKATSNPAATTEVAENKPSAEAAKPEATTEDPTLNTEQINTLVAAFVEKLNAAPIHPKYSVLVRFNKPTDPYPGGFQGFLDKNKSGSIESSDKAVFVLEYDAATERLIATDLQHPEYCRDRHHRRRHHAGSGILTGLLLGNMMRNQGLGGANGAHFRNTPVSPQGYHQSAQSAQRQRAANSRSSRSSRSMGGSRGIGSGK